MNSTEKLVEATISGIQEKKGRNITIIDLREIGETIAQFLVVCEGNSPTQVAAIADEVRDYVRIHAQQRPISVDGMRNSLWVALDYTDVVVHVFLPEARAFYDIDHLWEDASTRTLPDID